jgi:Family of unknown function (DUF5994)
MATQSPPSRLALRPVPDRRLHDGVWWPQSRQLSDQLGQLLALWPPTAGRIVRVLYSPPDWDDRPRSVPIPGGRIKTGCFPRDDTRQLILSMLDGSRRTLTVIPPDTSAEVAAGVLSEVIEEAGTVNNEPPPKPTTGIAGAGELDAVTGMNETQRASKPGEDHPVWDNEGGHP